MTCIFFVESSSYLPNLMADTFAESW